MSDPAQRKTLFKLTQTEEQYLCKITELESALREERARTVDKLVEMSTYHRRCEEILRRVVNCVEQLQAKGMIRVSDYKDRAAYFDLIAALAAVRAHDDLER